MDLSVYRRQFDKDQYAALSGIKLVEASPGFARCSMKVLKKHLNSVGVLHGGALFTLADFTFAVASNAHGKVALAIHADIDIFKSVSNGIITAVAREISLHTKLATYLVDLTDESGELLATFKGTAYRKNETLNFSGNS